MLLTGVAPGKLHPTTAPAGTLVLVFTNPIQSPSHIVVFGTTLKDAVGPTQVVTTI